jgi:ligand-binding sensor domain-containing protein/two-component sensor histidine kinase
MNRRSKIISSLFFLLYYSYTVFSQQSDFKIRTFTTENGLPPNKVRMIAQDQDGFLWIATWDGLACFDGLEFKKFYHVPGDPTTIPYFEVHDLAIDGSNTIWVIAKHLCAYNRDKNNFLTYSLSSSHYLQSDMVYSLATDKDSCLYVWGDHGLARFNPGKKRFEAVEVIDPGKIMNHTDNAKISIDEQNQLWFFTENTKRLYRGVIHREGPAGNYQVIIQCTYIVQVPDLPVTNYFFRFHVYNPGTKKIWITSNAGLFVNDPENLVFRQCFTDRIPLPDFPEHHSLLWSEFGKGVYYYKHKTGKIFHYSDGSAANVESFFTDRDGTLWFGGINRNEEGTGLHEIVFSEKYFRFYATGGNGQKAETAVFATLKDSRGDVWVGTKNENCILRFSPDGSVHKENILTGELAKQALHPRSIVEDRDHTIWIGYYGNLLRIRKAGEREFRTFSPDPPDDPGFAAMKSCKHILILHDRTVLIAGSDAICIVNPRNHKVLHAYNFSQVTDLYTAFADRNNELWFGSNGRLYHFTASLQLIESLVINNGNYNVQYICEDGPNALWLALLGGGICRFTRNTHQGISYTTKNGLSNNTTYCILKDMTGNLWISTDQGISMFNPATDKYVNFGVEDGLKIKEFNADAAFQSSTGEMLFGGMGGVVSFYPDSLLLIPTRLNPSVVITEILAGKQSPDRILPAYHNSDFILDKGTRNIVVGFSCIDFLTASQNQFRYRLQGISDTWTPLGTKSRSVSLSGLKPGSYVFQLEYSGRQGIWLNSNIIHFTILPFLYEYTWFWNSLILLFFVLLAGIVILYMRNVKIRNAHKLAQLRLITLQGKINPHFISNSLAVIESFIPQSKNGVANEYIYELSQMMRRMIDFSGEEYIPLLDDIELVREYLRIEKLRTNLNFEYSVITGSLDLESWMVAPLMIGSFVENVIKHGFPLLKSRQGVLVIKFGQPQKNSIECTITDNGIGWKKAASFRKKKSRISKGIEVVKERLNLYNMLNDTRLKLSISELYPNDEDKGTVVKIDIPIKRR